MKPDATLTPPQEAALAALLAGKSPSEAADDAGVNRVTLWRWQRDDHDFAAAFNRGRRDLREALHARLMKLADKAAATVETAIGNGDAKAALAVLRGLGLLDGEDAIIGSDNPADLRATAERRAILNSFR